MQNKVYSRYIYQMLMEYGSVAIPEIGTFYLEKRSSMAGENKQSLTPPSTFIYFSPGIAQDCMFSDLLNESGLKTEESDLLEKLVVSDYIKSVRDNFAFELDGLGKIFDGKFEEFNGEVFNRYKGLKETILNPINRQAISHDDHFEYYMNKNDKPHQKGLNTYFWPLLVAFITIFVIIMWTLSHFKKDTQTTINNIGTEQKITTGAMADSMYSKIDEIVEDEKQNTVDTTSEIDPLTPKENTTQEVSPKGESLSTKTCVVIIGTFSKVENANRLTKRINAKGYKAFKQDHLGMTRVGVLYDCAKHDPDEFRSKMKKIFNPDAWHLHDTL